MQMIAADDSSRTLRNQPSPGSRQGRRLTGRARLHVRSAPDRGLAARAGGTRAAAGDDRQTRRGAGHLGQRTLRGRVLAIEIASLRCEAAAAPVGALSTPVGAVPPQEAPPLNDRE